MRINPNPSPRGARIFPNGTSHMIWMERNCDLCLKRYTPQKRMTGGPLCDIQNSISAACATDGTLLHDGRTSITDANAIAGRLNWDGLTYLTHDCPERVLESASEGPAL